MSEYIIKLPNGGAADECIRLRGYEKSLYGYELHEEIVRCRDCEYADEIESGSLRCNGYLVEKWDYYNDMPSDGVKVKPDGYCAWAEKRTDE